MDVNEFPEWHEEIKNYGILHTFNASTGQKLTIIVIEIAVISSWGFNGF